MPKNTQGAMVGKKSTRRVKTAGVYTPRGIPVATRILLAVAAGGRCEFRGCNRYLFEHPLTLRDGNYSEYAHLVAFSENGPRGSDGERPENIHDVGNLMLLCPDCHKQIDDDDDAFPRSLMEDCKREHEERIRHVTGLGPQLRTTVVQLKSRIAGHAVDIPLSDVVAAVAPRYPSSKQGHVIDLTALPQETEAFRQAAEEVIAREVDQLYRPGMDAERTRHISLFALAPIYVLAYLGSRLTNKVPVDFYQRRREGTNPWTWASTDYAPVRFARTKNQSGTDRRRVALVISVSGRVRREDLPAAIDDTFTIYEIRPDGVEAHRDLLRRREDLEAFRRCYRELLAAIRSEHGDCEVHAFPGVPAPVAVSIGYDRLPKVDPAMIVYDYDKAKGGFIPRTTL